MANDHNRFHHHHHHHQQHHNLHMHRRSTFLPMLCSRPSIRDVRFPSTAAPFKEDPNLSPRISCMGQVKRSNKVNGFPTPHRLTITNNSKNNGPTSHSNHNNNFKYSKLKKLFSNKNLTATTTTITTTTTTTTRCRRQVIVNASSGPRVNGHHNNEDQYQCVAKNINLVDLDPPLPVIKRVHKKPEAQEEEVNSLWKRRSGGAALEGLQLKLTHHPRHQNQPTTV